MADWSQARSRKPCADEDDVQVRKPATFFQRVLASVMLGVLAVVFLNTGVPILGVIAGVASIYQFVIAAIARGVKGGPDWP